jgi:hypothetical protein
MESCFFYQKKWNKIMSLKQFIVLFVVVLTCSVLAGSKNSSKVKYQSKCPVMGGKISKKLYFDYKEKRIFVCCKGCIALLKKNPDKYIMQMEKKGIVLERVKTSTNLNSSKKKH